MKKRNIILAILFIVLFQEFSNAQMTFWRRQRKEIYFGGGATNFLGDLGGANQVGTNGLKDFDFPAIRPTFHIGYRYRTSKETAIKGNLIYARLAGNDKYTEEPFRKNRNCNFRTPVIELNAQFEYTITRERPGHIYNLKGIVGLRNIQITTYLFAGIGGMYFNPKGEWNGKWYALKPLSTEGEGLVATRKKYSSVQFVIPVGIGFKYALNKDWSIGIEYGMRKTFTDYVDDVSKTYFDNDYLNQVKGSTAAHFANPTNLSLTSIGGDPIKTTAAGEQRGDPKDKDAYMFGFISFYYKIKRGQFTLPKFR
jgi:hypothetical protein